MAIIYTTEQHVPCVVSASDCATHYLKVGDRVTVLSNTKSAHLFVHYGWMTPATCFTYLGHQVDDHNRLYNFESDTGYRVYFHHVDFILIEN